VVLSQRDGERQMREGGRGRGGRGTEGRQRETERERERETGGVRKTEINPKP